MLGNNAYEKDDFSSVLRRINGKDIHHESCTSILHVIYNAHIFITAVFVSTPFFMFLCVCLNFNHWPGVMEVYVRFLGSGLFNWSLRPLVCFPQLEKQQQI